MPSPLSILASLLLLSSPIISKSLPVISWDDTIDNEISFDVEPKVEVDKNDVRLLFSENEALDIQRQAIVNKIVDRTIAAIVKNLTEQNQGKIEIPDLDYSFSTGSSWWETTGDLNGYDGTFEDLTTLNRTEEANMKREGKKVTISCGIGVTRAQAEYRSYKLRYGWISVSGEVTGTIDDGVAIYAAASADYGQKQCKTVLENLRVSQLGKINIQMSGLGPLNGLLSSLVTWIAGKWQDDIVATLEKKLKQIANDNLDVFDCEKFRPWGV